MNGLVVGVVQALASNFSFLIYALKNEEEEEEEEFQLDKKGCVAGSS